jgi:hypothetical protein
MNLNDLGKARPFMLSEIDRDITNGSLYASPRLSPDGTVVYPNLLRQAAEFHDDNWLATQLAAPGMLNSHVPRTTKTGTTMTKMPVNAAETLAEGEFNRFYIRGLCLYAESQGISHVVAYRARYSENPRPETEARVGRLYPVPGLLHDLRNNVGIDTALGVPPGPNSGLSVKLP